MAKQKVTTKSSKRYTYSSFKSKVDNLRIEPARNLQKRVHDYVESSHFLASFEHWKEINLSAEFGRFADKVENLVQTLPQIIYHDETIFDSVISSIEKHDEYSLEPLLDLLAQFCHDLGPDFLKFYERALTSLIRLLDSAVKFESSKVFEWGFNCLAYIFKYLSRLLSDDLMPTFNLLFPLLSHSKQYISRFSAEALSFLIRRSKQVSLSTFLSFSFEKLDNLEDSNLYDGMLLLFSEALTSTANALHSRSKMLIEVLLDQVLSRGGDIEVNLFCDVWLNIARHASSEHLAPLYGIINESLRAKLKSANPNGIAKVLTTLAFAESGKKVTDWSDLVLLGEQLLSLPNEETINSMNLTFMIAVLFRNCDLKTLTQHHRTLFERYLQCCKENFIPFFAFLLSICSERALTFNGGWYLQQYLNLQSTDCISKLALFSSRMEEMPHAAAKLQVSIPKELESSLLAFMQSNSTNLSDEILFKVYQNALVLRYGTSNSQNGAAVPLSLAKRLMESVDGINEFSKDVIGYLLLISDGCGDSQVSFAISVLERLADLRTSVYFIKGFNRFLCSMMTNKHLKAAIEDHKDALLSLSDNLLFPDREIRYETIKLVETLLKAGGVELPQLLHDCRNLEDVPLTIENARDITTRIRGMGAHFINMDRDILLDTFFIKHLFGLLTVRFSPIWEGIYELIPKIYNQNEAMIWELLKTFLRLSEVDEVIEYYDISPSEVFNANFWESRVPRLREMLGAFDGLWKDYNDSDSTLLQVLKQRRGSGKLSPQIRTQMLRIMAMIPQVVERHSRDIVPYIFNQGEFEQIFDVKQGEDETLSNGSNWTEADRNSLLKIIGKFKNIKSIYKSSEVRDRLMVLLGSRSNEVQKIALECLLAYRDPVLIKFKDSMSNLLDDSLFKDEITRLLTSSQIINEQEEAALMPYALRILFGRAQTPNTSGVRKGRKHAVMSVLPGLKDKFIEKFFELGSSKFEYQYFFENGHRVNPDEFTLPTLRRMIGYVNILNLSFEVLGSKFSQVKSITLQPLLYTVAMSYYGSQQLATEVHIDKMVSNLRQQSLKCLNSLFQSSGDCSALTKSMHDIQEIVIRPRMEKFEDENLQQVSSLMKMILYWTSDSSLYRYLYYDEYSSCMALMNVLSNPNAKESVVGPILKAANDIVCKPIVDHEYTGLVALVAATSLKVLPRLYNNLSEASNLSLVIDLVLNLVNCGYVQDNETTRHLLDSLTLVSKGKFRGVSRKDMAKVLQIVAALIESFECSWSDVFELYRAVSSLYEVFAEKEIREGINRVLFSFAKRFSNLEKVAQLVSNLNSYSSKRLQEYDFPRILSSFQEFNEKTYHDYTELEWLPVIYSCLFFIHDKEELAIRSNASHTLFTFVDYINEKSSQESAGDGIEILEKVVLSSVRSGLQKTSEDVQREYISVLAYVAQHSIYFKGLEDMKILLFDGDEEANFFVNVVHVQLHRRLRAVKRLRDHASDLSDSSIAHYLMPIIEQYVFSEEEKFRNIGNEALLTIGVLSNHLSWNQYKALFRRYISLLKSKPEQSKDVVNLICQISVALRETLCVSRGKIKGGIALQKLPARLEDLDTFIFTEVYPKLCKVIEIRDSETILKRIPLAEALVNLILGLEYERTVELLPGILTSVCQVLRSKSAEVRDAVRKTLGNICCILGASYLTFVIKELTSALKRGSHIHVLSFTLHSILKSMEEVLSHSDLDPCSDMIARILMDDLFGSTGEEKDSENYHTTMKEVKVNKSYDTAEMLSANISLSMFSSILSPIKALLMERINLRNQNKLDELLRRYALGLKHNSESSSPDVLALCYEIFQQGQEKTTSKSSLHNSASDERMDFFLVDLNAKREKVQNDLSHLNITLQKFALELLNAVLFRNRHLLDPLYLDGFIPLLRIGIVSEKESVVVNSLKVLILLVKLNFPEESETIFKSAARIVLSIIKDCPSTSSELCQMGLKYLSSFIRHKNVEMKDSALSYVLSRILPDLNEPHKQGLAFNFLKALVAKQIKLPELYDVMNSVREIMVTNHTKEIRDISRSVYYQFLMEYDQSKGRLEKQFKFMVDNLQYPSQEGRQSVMELINLFVSKANAALLSKLSSSFFVALANVFVNDDSPRCREMAGILITNLLKKLDSDSLQVVTTYIIAWLRQVHEPSYISLGLRIYKLYQAAVGESVSAALEDLALSRTKDCIENADTELEDQWVMTYTALTAFDSYVHRQPKIVYSKSLRNTWNSVISLLLYPHLWVRHASARLVGFLIENVDSFEHPFSDSEIQTIVSRIARQLSAPSVSNDLAAVSIKTLLRIATRWKEQKTDYVESEDDALQGKRHTSAIAYMISRIGAIIRSEENQAESFASKKACIQLLGFLIQLLGDELRNVAEALIMPLFVYLEYDVSASLSGDQKELGALAQECLQMLEAKLSVSDFTKAYANVKLEVINRRKERKAKRSILAVTEPERAARRKLKKHARSREKRRHEKDDSGYYQRKNKRTRT
ncbi:hypothetical protein HG536_0G03140 [Torulaspora globosa]|uniref:Uncharacterized protein n=1 Tax=Torulaspora globosa TaxID=48254 RepID=A0A7G3ZLR6_9SACH|nr:uncharacterized protein HG536_0G03140 [Torulaspora globosa]QLL34452.1 hypothetical protein HG536_0G03140 [Torulaspora globosa]